MRFERGSTAGNTRGDAHAPSAGAPQGIVLETIRVIAPVEFAIFAASAILNLAGVLHSPPVVVQMELVGALVSLGVTTIAWARKLPPAAAHPTAALLLLIGIDIWAWSMYTAPSASKMTGIAVIILGSSLIFLSIRWHLALVLAAGLAAFVATMFSPHGVSWPEVLIPLAAATVISIVLGVFRIRTLLRVEGMRAADAQKRELIESRERELRAVVSDLRVSRQRYQELFHRVPIGIYRSTPDGRFIEANETAMQLLGVSDRGALLRLRFDSLCEDPAEAARRQAKLDREGSVQGWVFRARRPDGTEVYLRNNATVMRDAGGSPLYHEGVLEDVTTQRLAEERIAESRAEAQRNEKLAALGTLVAGVAHEVNNPLTYIRGNVEMLQRDLQDAVERGTSLPRDVLVDSLDLTTQVLAGVDRIAHITKSLKVVARGSSSVREMADVNTIVEGALTFASTRIKEGVLVRLETGAQRPVLVDANEISQVVLNLIFNAADAVSQKEGGAVQIRTRDDGENVLVEVVDNGVGIPAELQQKVFTPFHTTKEGGTGLGLSVSHRIVHDHGGDLSFVSAAGRGTTFTLALPCAPEAGLAVVSNPALSRPEAAARGLPPARHP